MSESCFICDKHQGRIQTAGVTIYEDDYVYVGHIDSNGKPNYLGHLMIDLKRHVPTLGDMKPEEASAFGLAMGQISKALKESANAEHVYAVVSGNAVPHVHMHIIPRYPNTPKQFWAPFAVYDAPNAKMGNEHEVKAFCRKIKFHIETTSYE